MLTAYAVKDKGTPEEQRVFLGFSDRITLAESDIRNAIARGFDYGYIKEDGVCIGFHTEESLTIRIALKV